MVSVPDPVTQQFTRVDFNITVPPYQSNELQVGITWGDIAFSARWIGDELWVADADFPINTEDNLVVTFYDANGDITLGHYETVFRTGVNDSQSYQISADQLNVDQWDTDNDGISNLDESIAGTDPLLDESSTLQVVDSVMVSNDILSVSQQLEASLGEQRPYLEVISDYTPIPEEEPDGIWILIDINFDIDADGNGTMSDIYKERFYSESHSCTRTHFENSISWEGSFKTFDGDYSRTREFTNETTYIDENTRGFTEKITETYSGFFTDEWEISSNITGELIDATSLCQPVSGTISRTHGTNREGPYSTESITVSKEVDDPYWKVITVSRNGDAEEYLARELIYG